MFTIEQLCFKDILKIDRLVIEKPVTCIVGHSGSGKTTLLKTLNRLYTPDSGLICYNGTNLTDIDPVALRRRVVMLGQNPVLYPGTVGDNLQIGLRFAGKKPADDATLSAALQQVELSKSPGDEPAVLSGGERQRLCLARVLLMDAQTYLLDEPSSALDKQTEQFILYTLNRFVKKRGRELVLVTHSPQVAQQFPDAVVCLEKGRVV